MVTIYILGGFSYEALFLDKNCDRINWSSDILTVPCKKHFLGQRHQTSRSTYIQSTPDKSNLALTRGNFCFPSDYFYTILPWITQTLFYARDKSK